MNNNGANVINAAGRWTFIGTPASTFGIPNGLDLDRRQPLLRRDAAGEHHLGSHGIRSRAHRQHPFRHEHHGRAERRHEPTRPTTTTVTSNNNPSVYGQSVTFTATVTATAGDPGANGSVTFKSDGTAISGCSSVALNASSQAPVYDFHADRREPQHHGRVLRRDLRRDCLDPEHELAVHADRHGEEHHRQLHRREQGLRRHDGGDDPTRSLTGVVGSDVVTCTGGTATFANKNVGTGKTVTVTGISAQRRGRRQLHASTPRRRRRPTSRRGR